MKKESCLSWSIIRTSSVLFILFSIFLPIQTLADEYHFNSLIVGDRASGMGGAYTALSDDAIGLYYNPAGVVFGEGKSSASLNAYARSSTQYEKVMGDLKWTRTSGEIVPGLLGATYTFKNKLGTAGFSLAVADSEMVEQDLTIYDMKYDDTIWFNEGRIHHKLEYRVYNAGPSYAYNLTDNISIGTTLYLHWRKKKENLDQKFFYYLEDVTEFDATSTYTEEEEWGIKPILGMMWKSKNQKYSLGLTMSKVYVVNRNYEYEYTRSYYYGEPGEGNLDLTSVKETSSAKRRYPFTVGLGAALELSKSILVSGDLTYYSKTKKKYSEYSPNTFATKEFFNTALGLEYSYNDNWIIRSGVFTNFANTEMDDISSGEHRESIDMYGGSLSVTLKKDKYVISLGGSYSTGDGRATLGDFGFGDLVWAGQSVDARRSAWNVVLCISK